MLQVVYTQRAREVARRRGVSAGHHVPSTSPGERKCENARKEKQLSSQTYSKATHGLPVACFSLITSQIFLPAINDRRAIDVAHQHKKQVTPAQERRTSRAREGERTSATRAQLLCPLRRVAYCDEQQLHAALSHARTSVTRSVAATSHPMASVLSRAVVCSVDEGERHEHAQTTECAHPYKKLRAKSAWSHDKRSHREGAQPHGASPLMTTSRNARQGEEQRSSCG